MDAEGCAAFSNTFQALYRMAQLLGLASQNLMVNGYGYGGEGNWKVTAVTAILKYMGENGNGASAFTEDYTYHLTEGQKYSLGEHMLVGYPSVAAESPRIKVHPLGCESIVEAQKKCSEGKGGEDVKEQTGAGTDVGSRLDVCFGLQPVEKDLDRLPQGTDMRGRGILGNQNIVLFPLSRRDKRDVPLGLQMRFPVCVNIGTICIEPAVCDRRAVKIDLLCGPQVAETGFADLYGTGDRKLARPQLGENMQLDAVIPQVFRGISC